MKRPLEHHYASNVAYTRALEAYCDSLANVPASDMSQKRVDETAKQRHEQEPVIDKSAAIRIATALGWAPKRKPLTKEIIDDIWNYHCDEMGYVSVSDAVELTRSIEALHGIKE